MTTVSSMALMVRAGLGLDPWDVFHQGLTLHTPMTAQTKNILSAENLARTKKGVRIVNCARGGLVDELAVRDLLVSGHIAGAGFDVFVEEPAEILRARYDSV